MEPSPDPSLVYLLPARDASHLATSPVGTMHRAPGRGRLFAPHDSRITSETGTSGPLRNLAALEQHEQRVRGHLAKLDQRMPDRREGRGGVAGRRDVVEPDQRDVLRHPDAGLVTATDHADRRAIVERGDGGRAFGRSGNRPSSSWAIVRPPSISRGRRETARRVWLQPDLGERLAVAEVPGGRRARRVPLERGVREREVGDPPVPELQQVLRGQVRAAQADRRRSPARPGPGCGPAPARPGCRPPRAPARRPWPARAELWVPVATTTPSQMPVRSEASARISTSRSRAPASITPTWKPCRWATFLTPVAMSAKNGLDRRHARTVMMPVRWRRRLRAAWLGV